jgi:hypothetical protein
MKFKLESLSLSSRPDQLQVAQCIGLINDSVGFSEHEDQSEGYALSHYGDYLEQVPYLLFLKMADEYTRPPDNRKMPIPTKVLPENNRHLSANCFF